MGQIIAAQFWARGCGWPKQTARLELALPVQSSKPKPVLLGYRLVLRWCWRYGFDHRLQRFTQLPLSAWVRPIVDAL